MNIIVNGGGINWCWYHWLTIEGKVATQTRADRFHKWDTDQGAGQHPKTDLYCNVYRGHNDMDPKIWGQAHVDEFQASWKKQLEEHGLSPDCQKIIVIRKIGTDESNTYELK